MLLLEGNAYAVEAAAGTTAAFDTSVIDWAIGELCGHITGNLGGLLVTVAAFGAIVSAALGSFRVTYSAIITAVGAYAIASIMSLYFEDGSTACLNGSDAGGITDNGNGNGNGNGNNSGGNTDNGNGNGNNGDITPRLATSLLRVGNPNLDNNSTTLYKEKNQKIDPFEMLD